MKILVLLIFFNASAVSLSASAGSAVCAECHLQIYKSYSRTPMARSSGRTGTGSFEETFERSEFSHAGARYLVYRDKKGPLFEFDLDAPVKIHGTRRLEYFIGSGAVGRSYLYTVDGFLYQAPVSYYSQQSKWDVSPGYREYDRLYLTRPVEAACLQCHASRLQPIAGTQNRFDTSPFLEDGVACELCHGDGEAHVRSMKPGAIVNPAKLAPDRRDSVCARCHLSGAARIDRIGGGFRAFKPGDLLSDRIAVFVWQGPRANMKATSHVERLAQSRCKIESGDRLWCGSCHDSHSVPLEAEKAAYFGGKCSSCHPAGSCTKRAGDNCIGCHMPKNAVADVEHAAYTDHSIPRRPVTPTADAPLADRTLAPFGKASTSARDLGLAYAQVGDEARGFELLKTSPSPDAAALVQLAHLYDRRGEQDKAADLYEKALRADPAQVAAAINLAAIFMAKGRPPEAMRLSSDALSRSPASEAASMNLALAQYRSGDAKAAQATLAQALRLNPGATAIRKLLTDFQRPRAQP